jgi:hypothetical protein
MVSSQKWQQIRIRVPLQMLPGRAIPVNASCTVPAPFPVRHRGAQSSFRPMVLITGFHRAIYDAAANSVSSRKTSIPC